MYLFWQARRDLRFHCLPHQVARNLNQRLAQDCIKKVEVVEFEELGMEAVWRIEVEDFPAFIVVDDKGNDFYADVKAAASMPVSLR